MMSQLPILYQDQDLVVVHKRSGLLVHRSLIDRHATEFAMQLLRDQLERSVYPVHRLDRATSGALIFALSKEAARAISAEFSQATIEKKYLAVVRGHLCQPVRLDYPLREELDSKSDWRAKAGKDPQSAVTIFTPLASTELPIAVDRYPTARYSLIQAQPLTGRKHQIRRHLKHLKHPIIGDINYGVGKHNRFFAEYFGIRRLLLACVEISFQHPMRNEKVTVKSPLAPEFATLLAKMGWENPYG